LELSDFEVALWKLRNMGIRTFPLEIWELGLVPGNMGIRTCPWEYGN